MRNHPSKRKPFAAATVVVEPLDARRMFSGTIEASASAVATESEPAVVQTLSPDTRLDGQTTHQRQFNIRVNSYQGGMVAGPGMVQPGAVQQSTTSAGNARLQLLKSGDPAGSTVQTFDVVG